MLDTITTSEVGLEATIELSSRLENPETTFTITLNEPEQAPETGTTATKPVRIAGIAVRTEDGKTKVPGGPSALDLTVAKACIFELRTEPKVTGVFREVQDGRTKVTIHALIVAKAYEDRDYDSWERRRFRMIEFTESPMDIGSSASMKMYAKPRENNDIEMEIVFYM